MRNLSSLSLFCLIACGPGPDHGDEIATDVSAIGVSQTQVARCNPPVQNGVGACVYVRARCVTNPYYCRTFGYIPFTVKWFDQHGRTIDQARLRASPDGSEESVCLATYDARLTSRIRVDPNGGIGPYDLWITPESCSL